MEIYPSILAVWDASGGDMAAVVQAAQVAEKAGAVAVHVDVMDGKLVPARTFGAEMVAVLRAGGVRCVLDVHLMVADVAAAMGAYVPVGGVLSGHLGALEGAPQAAGVRESLAAGRGRVVFHPKGLVAPGDAAAGAALLARLQAAQVVGGVALDVDEEVDATVQGWLEAGLVAQVLVMSVRAGAGGQSFQPAMLDKVVAVKRRWPGVRVGVDGGVNAGNVAAVRAAGADFAVAGSAVFGGGVAEVGPRLAALRG